MASWAKQQRIDRYAILQDVFDRDKRHRFTQYAAARWPLSIAMNEFTAAIAWINLDGRLAKFSRLAASTTLFFSPDDRYLAIACADGGVRIFDLSQASQAAE